MKNKINSIHFVGIKGVGMTPLAVIAKQSGMRVTGSDVATTYITDEILKKDGIEVETDFLADHIANVDMVVTTGAHGGYDNEEVRTAREKNIPVLTQGEAVGYFMSGEPLERDDIIGISVVGCHGKTTTTAMIATIFQEAGLDPSFVIGTGFIPSLKSSGHYGKGKYFIAEADEYATEPNYDKTPKFLWQHPQLAVVTNIEYDHPDMYPTLESLIASYQHFMSQVISEGGKLVVCGDDPEIRKIIDNKKGNYITYGFNSDNNYVLSNVESVVGGMQCSVVCKESVLGTLFIPVLGEHNALNALAACIIAFESGLRIEHVQKGLEKFHGTKRRLEFVGHTKSGAHVFDDYAHHPTEIQKTLKAIRDRYQESNIICVFQPHTFSRTKLLFDQFKDSFSDVNTVMLTDIYASKREQFDATVSSRQLADAIGKKALYFPTLEEVKNYLQKNDLGSGTIIITMGAGDVYKIAYQLIS